MLQKIPQLYNTNLSLFILSDLYSTTTNYLSYGFETYCGVKLKHKNQEHAEIFKEIVHPEDYPVFICHLLKFNDGFHLKEEETMLRFKAKNGTWNRFLVKSRPFKVKSPQIKPVLISQIFELKENDFSLDYGSNSVKQEFREDENQQLLHALDEGFCIAECIFDTAGKVTDLFLLKTNHAFDKEVGDGKAAGKTIREIFPNPNEKWIKSFGQVALTGKSLRFQGQTENMNNAWLDLHIFKVGNRENRQVAVLFRNITDKKLGVERLLKAKAKLERKAVKRQKALEESKELLQTVFDTTNLGIAVLKPVYNKEERIKDFKFLRINKVLREMFLPKDVVGKTYLETSKLGVKLGIFNKFKKVFHKGESFNQELYFDEEGFNNWFNVTARSQHELLIVTIEDITERKREIQELIETTRFKKELVRTTPETILIINLNSYNVRYINKDIYPEVGMTRERIQGMPLAEILPFIHPRDREKIIDLHKKLLKATDEDVLDIELRLKLKGVSWEWFSVRGKVFHRRDEKWVNEYVVLVRNITQQKNTQRALLKAEKLSIQGEVAQTLAHELRNPLASIGMATDVLGKNLSKAQKQKVDNYLKILSRSTETINNQINNLLNLSNYSPSILKKQDLAKIVDETIQKASDRIYLAGIKVTKNYEGIFPVMADKEKLIIALLNIVVNASEATIPDQGIIELEISKKDTDFVLHIKDNGHGLEKEEIERLFDAFYTTKNTGVGVGLSSVKSILEEHDAKIQVSSTPNLGTCFKIFFQNAEIE